MRNFFKGLWQDETGAAGAEYALILAVVAVGIAVAAVGLGDRVQTAIQLACNELTTALGANAPATACS